MTTMREFNQKYKILNAEQKKAVDTIEGPVIVIAGPGTGKTQILTLRIANILKRTDTDPSSILALTFTEAGVSAMRKRLVSLIGPDGYRVSIHTFHGFCNATIQRFPDDFPRLISSEAITAVDKILLMREILEEKKHLKHLRPFYDNCAYAQSCLDAISKLKREYISPNDFSLLVAKSEEEFFAQEGVYHERGAYAGKMKTEHQKTLKKIERNKELIEIYKRYEELMRVRKLYDYDDMIGVVVQRLDENEDVLQRLQEEYHYILADEHQDANTAQNRLLELLVDFHEVPNLFIVGDEKQAIFRFQGASLENFLYFKKKYPTATVATLTDSYRSGQKILDVAHRVIDSSTENIERETLNSRAAIEHERVEVRTCTHDDFEALWVARDIQEKIQQGIDPRELAVLYRTNADAGYIARALEREHIPYTIESSTNALDDPAMMQFIHLLRAIAEYGNEEVLAKALHSRFLGIEPLDVFKILKYPRRKNISLYECLQSEKTLSAIGVRDPKKLFVFGKRLAKWAAAGSNDPVVDVFNDVLDTSGFLTYILNSTRSVELLAKLGGLARDVEQLAAGNREYTLARLMHHLDLMVTYKIRVTQTEGETSRPGVRLLTAHKAKGLEFDYVYIIGAWDTHWGNRRQMSVFSLPLAGADEQDNADERRLFYVALTRARVGISVSYGRTSIQGKERLPSQFIEEMGDDKREYISTEDFEDAIPEDVFFRAIPKTQQLSIHDAEYVKELFIEQGLSVTALNNYLECPWRFFYSNLIRIPKISNKHMILGTAVHAALRTFFDAGKRRTRTLLVQSFTDALEKTALSGSVFDEVHQRGIEALTGWFEARNHAVVSDTINEYKVDTIISLPRKELANIRIRGMLDKIEIHPDGVTVVDYKTGNPKSRNHILGNTQALDAGNYFRQLVFYKLLLDTEGKHVMKRGVIDFIQPKNNGTYTTEIFDITPQHVDTLLTEIADMVQEVLSLAFWDRRCEAHKKGACEYCALRDVMQ
tara:strand:- start:27009 stop:29993 length:2985 start_codon:yes stop_codon:yes gene_type:complete